MFNFVFKRYIMNEPMYNYYVWDGFETGPSLKIWKVLIFLEGFNINSLTFLIEPKKKLILVWKRVSFRGVILYKGFMNVPKHC